MYLLDTLTKYFNIVLTCIKMSPATQLINSSLLGNYMHKHSHIPMLTLASSSIVPPRFKQISTALQSSSKILFETIGLPRDA